MRLVRVPAKSRAKVRDVYGWAIGTSRGPRSQDPRHRAVPAKAPMVDALPTKNCAEYKGLTRTIVPTMMSVELPVFLASFGGTMNVDPKTTIGGVPILRVRDFFRRASDRHWSWEWPSQTLKLSRAHTVRLVSHLREEGYVEPTGEKEYPWRCTQKGLALAAALGTRPIAR